MIQQVVETCFCVIDKLRHFAFVTLFSSFLDGSVGLVLFSTHSDFDFWKLGALYMDYNGKEPVWFHVLYTKHEICQNQIVFSAFPSTFSSEKKARAGL